jgi:hypothetical protein
MEDGAPAPRPVVLFRSQGETMADAEWLARADLDAMLEFLRGRCAWHG